MINNKIKTILLLIFLSLFTASALDKTQQTVEQKQSDYLLCKASNSKNCEALTKREEQELLTIFCAKSSSETLVGKELFEATWYSTTLLKLLNGKKQEAINQLSSELSNKILYLHEVLEKNPCSISEESLIQILPFFRLIAAINKNHPIPEINKNVELMVILSNAIKENTMHYEKMLKAYK